MNINGIFEIALFPIPGCVCFPHTIMPLHVFEPRYRQMVKDCVEKKMLLGVCHTKSIERFATRLTQEVKDKNDLHRLYKQNLSTFTPEDVFSAGTVSIAEITEDGRYAIAVHMLKRFKILEIVSKDPYKIARCIEYSDVEKMYFDDAPESTKEQRQLILDILTKEVNKLSYKDENMLSEIQNEVSVNRFTFKLFNFLRLPELEMQEILNSQCSIDRLNMLYRRLSAMAQSPE